MDLLQGWVGVYIFFVMSGFLITSLLIGEENKFGKVHFGRFLLRREFRIVPAYYATIALYALICLSPIAHQYSTQYRAGFWYWISYTGDIATHISQIGTLFGHSWSLAVEQRFYLVWPFALFAFTRTWQARVAIFFIAVIAILRLPVGNVNAYFALVLGSAAAFLHSARLGVGFLSRVPMGVTAIPALAWIAVLHWDATRITTFSLLVALFLYHLTVKESRTKRLLSAAPLVWLGQRSYSFYLLHVIVLNLTLRVFDNTRVLGAVLSMALGIAVTVALAAVSYSFVEEPFRRLGRRLTERKPVAVMVTA